MQLGEIQHFNNTPLGEMQSGEMQLSRSSPSEALAGVPVLLYFQL
jgi:hypothetical protein